MARSLSGTQLEDGWSNGPKMIFLMCLASWWGCGSVSSSGTVYWSTYTWCLQHRSLGGGRHLTWRLSSQPKRTRGRLQGLFCLHLRSHAALPLQHSLGYKWVLRPSQIQEERNRIHFLIRGHFVEQLEKYCCSHLEKIQSATLAPVSHLFTTPTASTRFLSRS